MFEPVLVQTNDIEVAFYEYGVALASKGIARLEDAEEQFGLLVDGALSGVYVLRAFLRFLAGCQGASREADDVATGVGDCANQSVAKEIVVRIILAALDEPKLFGNSKVGAAGFQKVGE